MRHPRFFPVMGFLMFSVSVWAVPLPPSPTPTETPTDVPTSTPAATDTPQPTATAAQCGTDKLIHGIPVDSETDCAQFLCSSRDLIGGEDGKPANRIICHNDDPSCDATFGDDVCTFEFGICLKVSLPGCSSPNIGAYDLRLPSRTHARNPTEQANRDSILRALQSLGAGVIGTCITPHAARFGLPCRENVECDTLLGNDGVCRLNPVYFSPPVSSENCSSTVTFKVPLRRKGSQTFPNTQRFFSRLGTAVGVTPFDRDYVRFTCIP